MMRNILTGLRSAVSFFKTRYIVILQQSYPTVAVYWYLSMNDLLWTGLSFSDISTAARSDSETASNSHISSQTAPSSDISIYGVETEFPKGWGTM